MNNKTVYVCLFIFLFTLVACADISPSPVASTAAITSTPIDQSNASPTYDISIQATLDFISEERESGEKQGDEIVLSIEKYYSETGKYPEKLDELIPTYLNQIPLTITGEHFGYRLVKPQLYYLSFLLYRRAEKFACTYMSDLKTWECSGTGH